jgi:gamma-glutamyl-gamma-aminobutyrate hydrolase PuuD
MKLLGITQRVEVVANYGERRDCLDQRWWDVAYSLGFIPIPLPNMPCERIENFLYKLDISAILLSGGNSLTFLDDQASDVAPERDQFESGLIEWAINFNVPLLGVCRGMQVINHFLKGELKLMHDHTAVRHVVTFSGELSSEASREVNSYHNWGIQNIGLGKGLQPLAQANDGTIEVFQHDSKRVAGMMWHPERESPLHPDDIRLMKKFLL